VSTATATSAATAAVAVAVVGAEICFEAEAAIVVGDKI
jgi:hypothetical protein